jgi:hypothetical protein
VLNNREWAAQIGRNARNDCGNLYSPERIAKSTTAAYEDAITIFKRQSGNVC